MPTVTITTTTEQAQRLADALGVYLNLGRTATSGEVKTYIIANLKELVISHEKRQQEMQIKLSLPAPTSFDLV